MQNVAGKRVSWFTAANAIAEGLAMDFGFGSLVDVVKRECGAFWGKLLAWTVAVGAPLYVAQTLYEGVIKPSYITLAEWARTGSLDVPKAIDGVTIAGLIFIVIMAWRRKRLYAQAAQALEQAKAILEESRRSS